MGRFREYQLYEAEVANSLNSPGRVHTYTCTTDVSHLQLPQESDRKSAREGEEKPNERERFAVKQIPSLLDYRQKEGGDKLQACSSDKRQH